MSYIVMNHIHVPEGQASTFEENFAKRQGLVDKAPGFIAFDLLRPASGTADYVVMVRWQDEDSFMAWTKSQSFQSAHRGGGQQTEAAARPRLETFHSVF